MTFKKGESGNRKGRPKGTKNKTTEEIREVISGIVSKSVDGILKDLKSMQPIQRVTIIEKLLKYVVAPVKQEVELQVNPFEEVMKRITPLSEEDFEQLREINEEHKTMVGR